MPSRQQKPSSPAASGALRPGDRLIEADLANMLQMSRVPLREALKILETQGILASTRHRGTLLPALDDRRIDQICEARIALQRLAIPDAVENYQCSPQRLARLETIIATMEGAADHLDWMAVSHADLDFHREICRISEDTTVLTLWESLARPCSSCSATKYAKRAAQRSWDRIIGDCET